MRSYGQRMQEAHLVIGFSLVGVGIIFICLSVADWLYFGQGIWTTLFAETLGIFFIYKGIKPADKGLDYYIGNKGEKKVKQVLKTIPKIAHYHDVVLPNQKWNIDHVILSRKGIFALETKTRLQQVGKDADGWYFLGKKGVKVRMKDDPEKEAKRHAVKFKQYLTSHLPQGLNESIYVQAILVLTKPFNKEFTKKSEIPVLALSELQEYFKPTDKPYNKELIYAVRDELEELLGNGR